MSTVTVPHPLSLSPESLHARFLSILPRIVLHGRVYFRQVHCPVRREEAIAEMVALAWGWFVHLARQGKDATQFASALASYAARAVQSGRRLTGQEKAKDVLSSSAQKRHRFKVEPLAAARVGHDNLYGEPHGQYAQDTIEERLRDNLQTPVAEQAAFRLDFPAWLATVTERDRLLVKDLALGHRTLDLARKYGLSPARISQKRREFQEGWQRFTGDSPATPKVSVCV
jgi:hypothetical protein